MNAHAKSTKIRCFLCKIGRRCAGEYIGNDDKVAPITGITDQDGANLAEFSLAEGYLVLGVKRSRIPLRPGIEQACRHFQQETAARRAAA